MQKQTDMVAHIGYNNNLLSFVMDLVASSWLLNKDEPEVLFWKSLRLLFIFGIMIEHFLWNDKRIYQ